MSDLNWTELSEEKLLSLRFKELGLTIESSQIWPLVSQVLEELKSKNLLFQPKLYFGDEWFSPSGVCAVSIPFFLANSTLRNLEKKMMLECEGADDESFLKLFRHELGHAFDHAFQVSRRRKWQKIFGSPKEEYRPESYRPRPYSRNYVQNIPRWYAQAHPDEDFAETFAVWLDPNSNWKEQYKNWGALKKLLFMDELCTELSGKIVLEPRGRMISDIRHMQSSLKHFYESKKKLYAEDYPDFYDPDLLEIFSHEASHLGSAYSYMKARKKFLIETISEWTGERKVTVEGLVNRLITRCKELKLHLSKSENETSILVSSFLTTLVSHYLFTGHFKRTV